MWIQCDFLVVLSLLLTDQVLSVKGSEATKGCSMPLGMKSGAIKDTQITGRGGYYGTKHSNARLDGDSAWCSVLGKTLRSNTFIQVDLGELYQVTSIAFQAGQRAVPMSKFFVRYRKNIAEPWISYRENGKVKVISATDDSRKEPFIAQEIIVYPLSTRREVGCLRMEFYGCLSSSAPTTRPANILLDECEAPVKPNNSLMIGNVFNNGAEVHFECEENFSLIGSPVITCQRGSWTKKTPKCKECPVKLGMRSGAITDSQITGEGSYYGSKQSNARLHGKYEWCAVLEKEHKEHTFIKIDLKRKHKLTKFVIQGGHVESIMSKFLLRHKINPNEPWIDYRENGKVKIITANNAKLKEPFIARQIILFPFSYKREIGCMRMELYGCPLSSECPRCTVKTGMKTACNPVSSPYEFGVVLGGITLQSRRQGKQIIQGQVMKNVHARTRFLFTKNKVYTFTHEMNMKDGCSCPMIKQGKTYLIFGKLKNDDFVIDSTSLVEEWLGRNLEKKVKKRCTNVK